MKQRIFPKLPIEAPPIPADLDEDEQRVWHVMCRVLIDRGVLTRADRLALEQLVIASVHVDRLRVKLAQDPDQQLPEYRAMLERLLAGEQEWLHTLQGRFFLDPDEKVGVQ